MPFFRVPLRDVQSVEYRHQIQRDLEQQPLAKAVADFGIQMRGHLALSRKLRARYQRERWYLEAAHVYCQAVTTLRDSPESITFRARKQLEVDAKMFRRLSKRSGYTFTVPERDENGLLALSDLTDRGLNNASNALAQSVDHIRIFFGLLRPGLLPGTWPPGPRPGRPPGPVRPRPV